MEVKVLVAARDPGGANAVAPLLEPISQRGFLPVVCGKDYARSVFFEYNKSCIDLRVNNVAEALEFCQQIAPSCIITGTSADDFSERYLWLAGNEFGIPTIAVLDQWVSYGIRFSGYALSQLAEYKKKIEHPFVPDCICVMDVVAQHGMVDDGIPLGKIKVTGNPYFDLLAHQYTIGVDMTDSLSRNYDLAVLYVSEDITETYGSHGKDILGYDEQEVLACLVSALREMAEDGFKISLQIRTHPKESPGKFADYAEQGNDNFQIQVNTTIKARDAVLGADIVVGMSSALLTEAIIGGKPIVSVRPGNKSENSFNFASHSSVINVFDYTEMSWALHRARNMPYKGLNNLGQGQASENILRIMEDLI